MGCTPNATFSFALFGVLVGLIVSSPVSAVSCQRAGDTIMANGFEQSPQQAFYVATNGSNAGQGSATAPWKTIQYAVDTVAAGNLICVRGGVYNELVTITQSGSAQAGPILLQSVPGETAVIDGTGLPIPDGQYGLLTLIDASWITVQGLELRNYSTASTANVPIGLYVTGAGTQIRLIGNHIHDIHTTANGCAANAFGLKVDGTRAPQSINQLSIHGNEIHDLTLGCSESFSLDGNVENWEISANRVYDTNNIAIGAIGFEGIAPNPAFDQARDGAIRENTIYNISSFGNPAYGNEYAADGIYVDGGTRILIERNLVHHVDIGIEVASEHAGRTSSDVIVRNNIVHSGNSAGISIGGYDSSVGGSLRVDIIGNTLFRNDQANTGSGEFQVQYHATDNRFINNIVHAGTAGYLVNAFTTDSSLPVELDENLYWLDAGGQAAWVWQGVEYASLAAWRTASGQDANALFDDPEFLAPAGFDLRVQPGSPAVNTGINLGAGVVGTSDFAGNLRVMGGAIDIGAHER